MIPNNDYEDFAGESDDDLSEEFEMESEPSLTYAMNLEQERFVGRVDEIEAIKQTEMKIISTERYEHEIYSWDYGISFADLRGQPVPYVMSEIEQRIIDALTADDRIESVEEFEISMIGRKKVYVKFRTITAQGDEFETEAEVDI